MGSKIYPDLVQSKLFFELDLIPFIGELEVKESGPLSQVTGMDDHRSNDGESQKQLTWKGLTFAKKVLFLLAWHGCDAAMYSELGIRDPEFKHTPGDGGEHPGHHD